MKLLVLSLLGAVTIAGCANLAWEKQGAGAGETSEALNNCRRIAQFNSFQLGQGPAVGVPNVIMTPAGPTTTFQPPGAVSDPALVEEYTRQCMEQKGFALVERR